MVSKQVTKIVQNLEKKKFRDKYNLFKTEGEKLVGELLRSPFGIRTVIALPEWMERHPDVPAGATLHEATEREMQALSNFPSPPPVIALAEIPSYTCDFNTLARQITLGLNGIQDPGNLGTILRVADWFGIRDILCDADCASPYNPKCVQASMGAIFRVRTHHVRLPDAIRRLRDAEVPVYGTFLDGDNIYTTPLPTRGLILMGNEGKGIAPDIEALTDHRLTIPAFAGEGPSGESLNVGVATGIVLSEFKRRIFSIH